MSTEVTVAKLFRWRMAQAEREAPPAPRGAGLLEVTRSWWETWPERFQSLVDRLGRIEVAYGHAMALSRESRTGHPVAAVVVCDGQARETCVCVLYFNVRSGKLRVRFQLDAGSARLPGGFDATFVADGSARPLFSAPALRSVDSEYRIDSELPDELAVDWARLKVTDRMPFRLILNSDKDKDGG